MQKRILACTLSLALLLSPLVVPAYAAPTNFTDAAAGVYYVDSAAWAVGKRITSGKTEATFAPNEQCAKAQIVTFLYRYLGNQQTAGSGNSTSSSSQQQSGGTTGQTKWNIMTPGQEKEQLKHLQR